MGLKTELITSIYDINAGDQLIIVSECSEVIFTRVVCIPPNSYEVFITYEHNWSFEFDAYKEGRSWAKEVYKVCLGD